MRLKGAVCLLGIALLFLISFGRLITTSQNSDSTEGSATKKNAPSVFYLYSVCADLDGDGMNEKAYIKSYNGKATDACPKTLIIEKSTRDGQYHIVYQDRLISGIVESDEDMKEENWTALFDISQDEWAKANGVLPAGIHLSQIKGGQYPCLILVFAAGTGDCCLYQYNPKTRKYDRTSGEDYKDDGDYVDPEVMERAIAEESDSISQKAPEKVVVSVYTFREEKYGQPFVDIDWNNLSRQRCSVFRPEERIFVHLEVRGYDTSCTHKVVVAYHLPGKLVGRTEEWAINPESGLCEMTIPAGQERFEKDTFFREGFFFAQPGPRLIQLYLDGDIWINPGTGKVDFRSKPIKEIKAERQGELKFE